MQNTTDVSAAKARLSEYTDLLDEIDHQGERLEYIKLTMTSASSANLSGMPKSPSINPDRTANIVIRKMELEKNIGEALAKEQKERAAIEGLLRRLKPNERAVIRLRYFDRASWSEICGIMFGRSENYDEKIDSLMRKTFRLHGAALLGIEKALLSIDDRTEG